MNKYVERLYNGLWKENPTFVQMLGMCPTLAVTTSAINGIGMGLSTTVVLVLSNIMISALRKIIPDKVRVPAFIVVVASFVTMVQLLMQGFLPSLYDALGIYIPLIVVNCIILGRAEMFASKNSIVDSALDGLGMGLGFTLTLFIMGSIREILGSGTWLSGDWFGLASGFAGISIPSPQMSIMTVVPGGFFTFACVMAAVNFFTRDKSKIKRDFDCSGCVLEESCTPETKAAEAAAGEGCRIDEKTAKAAQIAADAKAKVEAEKAEPVKAAAAQAAPQTAAQEAQAAVKMPAAEGKEGE